MKLIEEEESEELRFGVSSEESEERWNESGMKLIEEEESEELRFGVSSEQCKPTTSIYDPTHFVRRENPNTRSRVLPVRFTPTEHHEIQAKSLASSLSLSEYVRRAALQRKLPPSTAPEINRAVYEELCRIGNNLNQLVKAVHSGKAASVGLGLFEQLQGSLRTLGLQILGGQGA